jgi:hypothetical protein
MSSTRKFLTLAEGNPSAIGFSANGQTLVALRNTGFGTPMSVIPIMYQNLDGGRSSPSILDVIYFTYE